MSIKAQIWVETIVYTLIFLVIIAAVLAFVKPSIEKQKDKAAISQGEEIMRNIDAVIDEVRYYSGNSRPVEIKLTRGKLIIDGGDSKYGPVGNPQQYEIKGRITFLLEKSSYKFGEEWANISVGNIIAETIPRGKRYDLQLILNYSTMNITFSNKDVAHTYQPSGGIYRIEIANKNGVIDFK